MTPLDHRLTRQEERVAELLTVGCTDKEIAERLWITVSTSEKHVAAVVRKLGAGNRTEAAVLWDRTRREAVAG